MKTGTGVASTLKKPIGSKLRYPLFQDVVWEKDACCNANQPTWGIEALPVSLQQDGHKPTFGVYLLHISACLMTCEESAPHLGAGNSLDSRITKEERKENATTYGFDW